jgi:thiamine pyrophosphate-dependent acetolactate synthase large subunit-like protein
MKRIHAIKMILEAFPQDPVITNCGATTRETAALENAERILYLEDSMGLASSIGLGLALAVQDRVMKRVIVLEGDGSLLMNFNSLASIAYYHPEKLLLVVLDNGVYASTGGQVTYASRLSLPAFARAGELQTLTAASIEELQDCLLQIREMQGCIFLHIQVEPGNEADVPWFLEDPAQVAYKFRRFIQDLTP